MGRTIVFVLGMHRSGTSAVTGALAALGAALPDDLLPPKDDNPRGFFESERLLALHDELLLSLDRSWDDATLLPSGWLESPAVETFATGARALLDELPDDAVVAIKDPRLCRVLPAWRHRVVRPDERPVVLFVTRPGREVVTSLARREEMPPAAGWLLLALHLAEALDAIAGLSSGVVSYPAVLEGWEAELRPALTHLGLADRLHFDRREEVAAFLSADLRHDPVADAELPPAVVLVRDTVDDVLAALDASRPALPSAVLTAALDGALADTVALVGAGALAPRRLLAEHRERERAAALEREALRDERDHWRACHDHQTEALARATAELTATKALLEETQQARSLRVARWLRSLGPSRPEVTGDR